LIFLLAYEFHIYELQLGCNWKFDGVTFLSVEI
jgi:hypothetical protein